jgi:hypothetical protein
MKVINTIQENKYGRPSSYSIYSLIDENEWGENPTYFSIVWDLFRNKVKLY